MLNRTQKTSFTAAVALAVLGFAFSGPTFAQQQGVNGNQPKAAEQSSKSSTPDAIEQAKDPCMPDDKGKVMPDCKGVVPAPRTGTVDMTAPAPDENLPKNPQSKANGDQPAAK